MIKSLTNFDSMRFLGVDLKKIDECMGDPEADAENAVLKAEQQAQVWFKNNFFGEFVVCICDDMIFHILVYLKIGKGVRGDVTILPTLVINNRQYRGKLDKKAVLKAICSGFEETTEPPICLSHG